MSAFALGDDVPQMDTSVYIAEGATVIGRVRLGPGASVWPQAVLRADNGEWVSIGARSNIQDGAVLHTDPGFVLEVGDEVSVGHQAMLHGCTIGSGSMIGIQAVILNGASIGRNSLVAAGAVVTQGKSFPDNALIVGAPAKIHRLLSEQELDAMRQNIDEYVARGDRYRKGLRRIETSC